MGRIDETVLGCLRRLVPPTSIVLGFAQEVGIATTVAGVEHDGGFDAEVVAAIESGGALRLFPRLAAAVGA